jgi:hypothetical protein
VPRKLKTYITNLGFFELALAAPSMKAALEAWGMGHNAFHQGFAKETDDPKIVAATMAKPGTVLRRPVGTNGEFEENAELPKQLWKLTPPEAEPPKPKAKTANKPRGGENRKSSEAAILSFDKAKKQRERAREKEEAKEAAGEKKRRARIERAIASADKALDVAQKRHAEIVAAIEQDREKLDRRANAEEARWKVQKRKLQDARERAAQ